jgi:hypothetical protein
MTKSKIKTKTMERMGEEISGSRQTPPLSVSAPGLQLDHHPRNRNRQREKKGVKDKEKRERNEAKVTEKSRSNQRHDAQKSNNPPFVHAFLF